MPNDPLDDLLSIPDGTVSPFDPLEADVPRVVATATFTAMRDDAKRRLDQHLAIHGLDGDVVGLGRRRVKLQQAIDALDWVATQPGPSVTLGCYPVDLAAENEYFDRLLQEHPDFREVNEDDLPIPRDRPADEISQELADYIERLTDNPPSDDEE